MYVPVTEFIGSSKLIATPVKNYHTFRFDVTVSVMKRIL